MASRGAVRSFEPLESRRVFSATVFQHEQVGYFLRPAADDDGVSVAVGAAVADSNTPPAANAGDDVLVVAGQNVTLDGSRSTDPDSGPSPLTYEWSVLTIPAEYRLAYYLGPKPEFMSLKPGKYVLELTVSDGISQSSDTMTVTVFADDSLPSEFPPQRILALGTVAGSNSRPRVKVVDTRTGDVISKFNAYSSSFHRGVHVVVADLDGDGNAEIITAPGAGNSKSQIKVFDVHGVELSAFRIGAFPVSFTGGVFIAAGDVDGDGLADLIAAPGSGRAAEIRVWLNQYDQNDDPFTAGANRKFLAFDARFKGGVTVSAGDLNGDGKAEIVVGSGRGMPPVVRVFDLSSFGDPATLRVPPRRMEIYPARSSIFATGFSVAVGNFSSYPFAEIAISPLGSGAGKVKVYDFSGALIRTISPFGAEQASGGVYATFKDVDDDEQLELLIAGRAKSGTLLTTWDSTSNRIDRAIEDDPDFRGGAFIG